MRAPIFTETNRETDRVCVLLAGESETGRDRLRRALSATEYRPSVDRVARGAAALSALADEEYDVVVASEDLPAGEVDGLELLRRSRRAVGDAVPFVFVSTSGDAAVIDEAIECGANRCLLRRDESAVWYRLLAEAVVSAVENRRTRRKLERTSKELQRIHDTVPAMITRKDTNNRLLSVNEAVVEYLDRPREEIEGKTGWELFPAYGDEFYEMDRRVIESGDPIEGEIHRLETPSGRERWIKTDAIPYRNEEGEVEGVLIVSDDITELKSRERELARQNERLDTYTATISHDLRNPLSVASGHLEMARAQRDDEHLTAIEVAHARMETLIQNLLALAREGEAVSEPELVDVSTLVDGCWRGVETSDATLQTAPSRPIRADRNRLKQLFENLFRNAIEHGGEDVTVTVGETETGLFVEDDGPGIPADRLDDVFEIRYSTSPEGSGFGLRIVEEIVEAHGWRIEAQEGTDGGARFDITGVEFIDI